MKKTNKLLLLLILLSSVGFSQVGIGTTNPDDSSILDLRSTTKGFLPPRLTDTQRDEIENPALGLVIYNTTVNCLQWWNGTEWYDGCGNTTVVNLFPEGYVHCDPDNPTAVVGVVSTTGRTWMDRNLGASQIANASNDANSYGDLYQWGRAADGHQCRTSLLYNSGLASTAESDPNNDWYGRFILSTSSPFDWLSPQNNFLWNTSEPTNIADPNPGKGATDPCPDGYRVPTESELVAERVAIAADFTNDAEGAFNSPLKLPVAGRRSGNNGDISSTGESGFYWSSTTPSSSFTTSARNFILTGSSILFVSNQRGLGRSVRCIKY